MKFEIFITSDTIHIVGLHYQSFCDHSRNFAQVNSKFRRICKICLKKLTQCLTLEFTYAKCYFANRKFDSVNRS